MGKQLKKAHFSVIVPVERTRAGSLTRYVRFYKYPLLRQAARSTGAVMRHQKGLLEGTEMTGQRNSCGSSLDRGFLSGPSFGIPERLFDQAVARDKPVT